MRDAPARATGRSRIARTSAHGTVFAHERHWNARGGEEWSVGMVIGAAALTAVLGTVALFVRWRRAWGVGLLIGSVLAPITVGAVFVWYFAILNGS